MKKIIKGLKCMSLACVLSTLAGVAATLLIFAFCSLITNSNSAAYYTSHIFGIGFSVLALPCSFYSLFKN